MIFENNNDVELSEYKQKLEPFFKKLSALATQSVGKVRLLLVLNLFSICWLVFYVKQLFDFSMISTVVIFVVISFPALLILKLYLILQEIIELPNQVQNMGDSIKKIIPHMKDSALQQAQEFENRDNKKSKLSSIFSMAKSLIVIKEAFEEAACVPSGMTSALLLGNPLFAMAVGFSLLVTSFLAFLVVISGIIYIF